MTQVKNHSGVLSPCFYTITKCSEHWEKFGTQVNQKVRFLLGTRPISANGSGKIAMTQVKNHSGVLSPCFYTITKCPVHWEKFGTQVNQKVRFLAGD